MTPAPQMNNGSADETLFTKPPARDGMTQQVSILLKILIFV
jgi:hypothetical protein